MANEAKLLNVKSCDLGKLGSDQLALKINFSMSTGEGGANRERSAVFGLTHELAVGLAKALINILEQTPKTQPN